MKIIDNENIQDILVSVIVPIYNVEKYLNRCIESIVNQTYSNLEIILVDDGSPDNCSQLCDDWEKKDNRINVIHKKNAGLGMARNSGIENSNGDYLVFIDSDDYVNTNMIDGIVNNIKTSNCDVYLFGFSTVDSRGEITSNRIPKLEKEKYINEEVTEYILPNLFLPKDINGKTTNLWGSAWTCAYSMRVIQDSNWRFFSEREYVSEDVFSLLHLYSSIKSVGIISESYYYYCNNAGSLTHAYNPEKFYRINKFYVDCIKSCRKYGYSKIVEQGMFSTYFSGMIGYLKNICESNDSYMESIRILKKLINNNELQKNVKDSNSSMEPFKRRLLIVVLRSRMTVIVYLLLYHKIKR